MLRHFVDVLLWLVVWAASAVSSLFCRAKHAGLTRSTSIYLLPAPGADQV